MYIDDLTPFVSFGFFALAPDGQWLQSIVTRGTYEILPNGFTRLADTQPVLSHFDTYYGDPKTSSLRTEHCRIQQKPRGEIYFIDPIARTGKPERNWLARFALGPIDVRLKISGPRKYYRNFLGLWKISEAEAIGEQSVRFEHAYGGGPDLGRQLETNPVGTGYGLEHYGSDVREFRAPQVEFFEPKSTGVPLALTPVHRAWMPRRAYAGTFDENWLTSKAPLYPDDFDTQFFLQSPSYLQLPHGYFRGNEIVLMDNLGTSGTRQIRLAFPPCLCVVAFDESHNAYTADLQADTIAFELQDNRVSVDWRTTFLAKEKLVEINIFEKEGCHA